MIFIGNMITRVRQYGKRDVERDAHKIFVVCEGASDEPRYFDFFKGLSANLAVITIPAEDGQTDPVKLMKRAEELFDEKNGRYSLDYFHQDRVWFIIDTDTWEQEGKIDKLRLFCDEKNRETVNEFTETRPYDIWNVAQSNPSFEIWQYYHFYDSAPEIEEVQKSVSFKQFAAEKISGGFNYEADPVRLKEAIVNSEANFGHDVAGKISPYATELHILGKEIHGFVGDELAKLYNKLK